SRRRHTRFSRDWSSDVCLPILAAVSRAQGILLGRLADVGVALQNQAGLAALTEEVVQTSAIEGEELNVASVRSSVARRLGVDIEIGRASCREREWIAGQAVGGE